LDGHEALSTRLDPARLSICPAAAQEYYDIDVDLPQYPEMQPIPDSPVYYAPQVDSNYFFYDGQYWDYYNDRWYTSAWYNGPWAYVDPIYVAHVRVVGCRSVLPPAAALLPALAPRQAARAGATIGAANGKTATNAIYTGRHATMPARAPLPTLPAPVHAQQLSARAAAAARDPRPAVPSPAARAADGAPAL
jgi:hypothetical protein